MALARTAMIVVWTLLLLAAAGAQDRAVPVDRLGAPTDLVPHLQVVEPDLAAVMIQIPGQPAPMALTARGSGPPFRWAVVTLANPLGVESDVVLAIPYRGLAGSGVLWPAVQGPQVVSLLATPTARLQVMNVPGYDAFSLSLSPQSRTVLAIELAGRRLETAQLWERGAFEAQSGWQAFLRGANLGIGVLSALAILAFFVIRNHAVFPAASLFAIAAVVFLALEAGYAPGASAWLGFAAEAAQRLRAIAESLMLSGLIVMLAALADWRHRSPAAGHGLLALAALSLALPVYGWFEPVFALGAARLGFAFAAAAGFVLLAALWRDGGVRVPGALIAWGAILLWTFVAAVAALSPATQEAFGPLLAWGLAAVLLALSFILAQFAFGQGLARRRLFEDAGRRALALAGAQQHVWDFDVETGDLYVEDDLERELVLAPGALAGGTEAWLDHVHPNDRSAYLAALEAAERRGRGPFRQEFRLQRGDGAYRWFMLRARAIAGPDRRAVRLIGTLADVTADRQAEDRLLSDAVYDRVTGLPNRALFADRLMRAIADVDGGQASDLHVLLVDLDRFKTLNDGLGRETGDTLLTITGRRLSALAGPEDTVARLPGDQFALLFQGSRPKRDIVPFAESLRKAVARPMSLKPQEIFLTACIGVAAYRQRGQTAEALLKDAAIALYEAKRAGKDTVEFFRTTMRDDRSELLALEAELRRAVERNEIEVFYQPIARLSDLDLAGFEALARWRHPTLGLLGPESFLALAEQTGIISDIGLYVLGEAARQLGVWQRAFRPREPLFVAVNISSSQLLSASLVEDVKLILAKEGIRRDTLKIEVTESIVMENPEKARGILERFREMGVGLACDDFGTGYSSLSNLRRLPFDTLKVDRSFVSPDPGDERAAAILETIVALAQRLGLTVVAEGVESQLHIERLARLGCDFGQGFFIGQPMSSKRVAEALTSMPYTPGGGRAVMAALHDRAARPDPPRPPPVAGPATAGELPRFDAAAAPSVEAMPPPRAERIAPAPELPKFQQPAPPPPPPAPTVRGILPLPELSPTPARPALGMAPMAPRLPKIEDVPAIADAPETESEPGGGPAPLTEAAAEVPVEAETEPGPARQPETQPEAQAGPVQMKKVPRKKRKKKPSNPKKASPAPAAD